MRLLECVLSWSLEAGPEEELPGIEFREDPEDLEEPEEDLEEPEEDLEEPEEPPDDFIEQPRVDENRVARGRAKRAPPVYGPLLVSGGLTAGPNSFGFGAGLTRFVIPWIGVGLELDEVVVFGRSTFNDFSFAGHVMILLTPYFRVTPYVRGALGPEFFSHGLGIYGQWKGGAGLIIRFGEGQRIALRLGADVVGVIPDSRFKQHFTCTLTDFPCSLGIQPQIGVAFAFGQR